MKSENEKAATKHSEMKNVQPQPIRNWLMMFGSLLTIIVGQATAANAATYTVIK